MHVIIDLDYHLARRHDVAAALVVVEVEEGLAWVLTIQMVWAGELEGLRSNVLVQAAMLESWNMQVLRSTT